jgi:hypothetical protein
MADIFTFPKIDNNRRTITAALTRQPIWDEDRLTKTIKTFELKEKERQDSSGPRLVIRSSSSELEIFRTSDSLRWSKIDQRDEEPGEPVKLPADNVAVSRADAFLEQRGLADASAVVQSVTQSHHSRIGKGNEVFVNHPVAKHVNYEFRVDELRVFGPGAKMQVTFSNEEAPVQTYKFWREPRQGKTLNTISYDQAVELIRSHPTFATMVRAGEAKVVFERVQLGYYAFPARERQGMLVPVYRFDGAAHSPHGEHYRFSRYVMAVALPPAEIKASRMTVRHNQPAVFSS